MESISSIKHYFRLPFSKWYLWRGFECRYYCKVKRTVFGWTTASKNTSLQDIILSWSHIYDGANRGGCECMYQILFGFTQNKWYALFHEKLQKWFVSLLKTALIENEVIYLKDCFGVTNNELPNRLYLKKDRLKISRLNNYKKSFFFNFDWTSFASLNENLCRPS